MPPAAKTPFPYPLQIGVMDHFCRPLPQHVLAYPRWHLGNVLAANGWFAIRATRGLWMRDGTDFPAADAPFLARFNKLPWDTFPKITADEENWQPLRDGRLFRHGPLALWLHGRPSPSPVWQVAEQHLARLSHLQLISRLPRCEVHTGLTHTAALFFRFSGGMGMIARDETLTSPSHSIFTPRRHHDGTLMARTRVRPPSLALPNWPPPVCAD